jgi:hypothetical protein
VCSPGDVALTLEIEGALAWATLINHGVETLRIWELTNSWGWGTFLLIISMPEKEGDEYTLVPKPQVWTANLPTFVDISSGNRHVIEISPGEPEWDNLDKVTTLREKCFYVRAVLRIPETPEAMELGVLIGEISSQQVLSQPPHVWLFP